MGIIFSCYIEYVIHNYSTGELLYSFQFNYPVDTIGYIGVPLVPVDSDACSSSPCLSGGTCIDHTSYHLCYCPEGFTGGNCETGSTLLTS